MRTHIIHQIERPKPEKPVIVPFTQDDIKRLLAAASRRSAPYTRPGKKQCDHERTTAVRDRAILLLLIDTGMRASELCGLELRNVDLRNGAVLVFGKGSKERSLPIGPRTKAALSKHILENRADARLNEPVFLTREGKPMDRHALFKMVYRLAQVAGVQAPTRTDSGTRSRSSTWGTAATSARCKTYWDTRALTCSEPTPALRRSTWSTAISWPAPSRTGGCNIGWPTELIT